MIKDSVSGDVFFAIPSSEYLFHFHVKSSKVGTGCIPIQQCLEGKGSNPSLLAFSIKQSRKFQHSSLNCVESFQHFRLINHYIIAYPFPIYMFCYHKTIFHLRGCKRHLSCRLFRYQVIITKIQDWKIIWTSG